MSEPSRRRRLVARLAKEGHADPADGWVEGDWDEEVRLLPDPEPRPAPAPVAPSPPPTDFPLVDPDPPVLPRAPAASHAGDPFNPGPLPDPLPPPLDAVVRGLREDLLAAGPGTAALADELCARHRDRLRAVLDRLGR